MDLVSVFMPMVTSTKVTDCLGFALLPLKGLFQGEWKEDRREGQGKCRFSDGTKFRGQWENDAWIQSTACPLHCIVSGDGRHRATAGKKAVFRIEVRIGNDHHPDPNIYSGSG